MMSRTLPRCLCRNSISSRPTFLFTDHFLSLRRALFIVGRYFYEKHRLQKGARDPCLRPVQYFREPGPTTDFLSANSPLLLVSISFLYSYILLANVVKPVVSLAFLNSEFYLSCN